MCIGNPSLTKEDVVKHIELQKEIEKLNCKIIERINYVFSVLINEVLEFDKNKGYWIIEFGHDPDEPPSFELSRGILGNVNIAFCSSRGNPLSEENEKYLDELLRFGKADIKYFISDNFVELFLEDINQIKNKELQSTV